MLINCVYVSSSFLSELQALVTYWWNGYILKKIIIYF